MIINDYLYEMINKTLRSGLFSDCWNLGIPEFKDPTIIFNFPIIDNDGKPVTPIKYKKHEFKFNFINLDTEDRISFYDQGVKGMTKEEAATLQPGDKIWLDECNWRIVDDIIYDIATVINPPTKLINNKLVINYEIRLGEASMVSSVYPEGCELHTRASGTANGEHKCYCDIMTLMSRGCTCKGI